MACRELFTRPGRSSAPGWPWRRTNVELEPRVPVDARGGIAGGVS
jgi:hypothetical protein